MYGKYSRNFSGRSFDSRRKSIRNYKKSKRIPKKAIKKNASVHPVRDVMPRHKDMIHVWSSPFVVTDSGTGGTIVNTLQIQLNNLYQPYNDVSGTTWTNQKQLSVQLFDYMQLYYDAYTVYRADVTWRCINQDTSNSAIVVFNTAETADAVARTMRVSDLESRPYAKSHVLSQAGGSRNYCYLKKTFYMNKLNGYVDFKKYLEDTGNINPTNTASTTQSQFLSMSVGMFGADTILPSAKLIGDVTVKYYARWRDRQPIVDQSTLG